jgi:hypothetical protein
MSVWRRKAIECLPECKKEFEQPGTSIYDVFIELWAILIKAHRENDKPRLQQLYGFAEWCLGQKEKELWNAAGVAFYEHLGDDKETLEAIPQWIKPEIYKRIDGLLEARLDEKTFKWIDSHFPKSSKK